MLGINMEYHFTILQAFLGWARLLQKFNMVYLWHYSWCLPRVFHTYWRTIYSTNSKWLEQNQRTHLLGLYMKNSWECLQPPIRISPTVKLSSSFKLMPKSCTTCPYRFQRWQPYPSPFSFALASSFTTSAGLSCQEWYSLLSRWCSTLVS